MRASRLLSILALLQLRVRLTAQDLADELEVTVRTIYRDIEALSVAGVPVYGESGPGGGFRLLDGYRTRLTGLGPAEAEAVLMIGLPGPAAALGLGAEARSAGRKLLASLPPALAEGAQKLGGRFHLDPVEWYRAAEPAEHLPPLARAVLDQRPVSMRYRSWKATRRWRVEPLGLVLKGSAWYLVARAGEEVRIFKVASVLALEAEEGRFERPAGFDLARTWSESLARFEAGLRTMVAELSASPLGRERLCFLGAWAARAVRAAGPPDGHGWARVALPVESVEQAALALLGLGPEVEVLGPPALRARLRALAEGVVRRAARPAGAPAGVPTRARARPHRRR